MPPRPHISIGVLSPRWLVTGALAGVMVYAALIPPASLELVAPPGSSALPLVEFSAPSGATMTTTKLGAPAVTAVVSRLGPLDPVRQVPAAPATPADSPTPAGKPPPAGAAAGPARPGAPMPPAPASPGPGTEADTPHGAGDDPSATVPEGVPSALPSPGSSPVTVILSAETAMRQITVSVSLLGGATGDTPSPGGPILSGRVTTG